MSATGGRLKNLAIVLVTCFVIYIPPADAKPVFGSFYIPQSPISIQYTREGLFVFLGQTQIFAPLTPDTLARIPRLLREGMGIKLVLAMAATPWILKASSLLFTGARIHFWGSRLWSSFRDEWYGVINKAIPLLFDNPLLQRRLLIRFVHDQGDSRWEILRIPAVPMPAAWERNLNSLELALYRLWRFMDHRQLDRLELRWDVEGRGWLSEFNRDEYTRVLWPEVISTTLEQELVAGEGRTVLQTLLHPARLLQLTGSVVEPGGLKTPVESTPAVEWSEEQFASVLSFGDQAETHLVWLKDSAYFSWQDSNLLLLRSGVSSKSLLEEINRPAMTVWQYQSAPLVLPPPIAERLVLEAASSLMDAAQNLWINLINWTAAKMQAQDMNMAIPKEIVPKDLYNHDVWSRYVLQSPPEGKKEAGNPSGGGSPGKNKSGSSKQRSPNDKGRNNRLPGKGRQPDGDGSPPDQPGSEVASAVSITSERRGRKRLASEQPAPVTKRPRQEVMPHQNEQIIKIKKEPEVSIIWQNNAALFNPAKDLSPAVLNSGAFQYQWQSLPGKTAAARQYDFQEKIEKYSILDGSERKEWIENCVIPGLYSGQTFPKLVGQNELRAARDLKKYEVLGHYAGIAVDRNGLERLSGEYGWAAVDKYLLQVGENLFISAIEHGNAMSLINANRVYADVLAEECPGIVELGEGHEKANAGFLPVAGKCMFCIFIVTLDEIKMGASIWADYGIGYWKRLYGYENLCHESESESENALKEIESDPDYSSDTAERDESGGYGLIGPKSIHLKLYELKKLNSKDKEYVPTILSIASTLGNVFNAAYFLEKNGIALPDYSVIPFLGKRKWSSHHINYLIWKYKDTSGSLASNLFFNSGSISLIKLIKSMNPKHGDFEEFITLYIRKRLGLADGSNLTVEYDREMSKKLNFVTFLNEKGLPLPPRLKSSLLITKWSKAAVCDLLKSSGVTFIVSKNYFPFRNKIKLEKLSCSSDFHNRMLYHRLKNKLSCLSSEVRLLNRDEKFVPPVVNGLNLYQDKFHTSSLVLWIAFYRKGFKDFNDREIKNQHVYGALKRFDHTVEEHRRLYMQFLSVLFHKRTEDTSLRAKLYVYKISAPDWIGKTFHSAKEIGKLRKIVPEVEFKDGTAHPDGKFIPKPSGDSDDELSETESTDEELTD